MKKKKNFIDSLGEKLFSNTYQLERIVLLIGILLVVAVASFAAYYYYDRYYTTQPKVAEMGIDQAEQAVRENPQDPEVRLNLAEVYMINRRFDDALVLTNQIMEAYPDNQRAWFLQGVSYALKGNYADAVDPLQRYMDANKDSDMAAFNTSLQSAAFYLGDSYLQLGQPEKAIPVLEMNYEWAKTDADTMYKLGVAYTQVKEYEKALVVLHRATEFVPDYTEVYEQLLVIFNSTDQPALADYARGMIAYSKQDYQTAKDILTKSSQETPSAPTFAGLGMVYESLEDYANAITSYEAALKLDPSNFTAMDGLKRAEILLQK
jgi:tetratricopeptide (TPR) repeat protein